MYKRVILITAFLILILVPSAFAFDDIECHWAKDAIVKFTNINIIKGYNDNTFRPNDNITRAEFITLVNRILNNSEQSDKFIPDIQSKNWYYEEIKKSVASGLLKGDQNGNMNPESYITREEAVVILARAFGGIGADVAIDEFIDKNEVSSWSAAAFSDFISKEYIKGYEDNTIKPRANITRAEVITIIDRMFAEIIISGNYNNNIKGSLVVTGQNVDISNLFVQGNLVITEGTKGDINLSGLRVEGDIVLRTPIDILDKNINIGGSVIRLYESAKPETVNYYTNNDYGIKFALPDNAKIIEINDMTGKVDYSVTDLITVKIVKKDDLHYKSINQVVQEQLAKYKKPFEVGETIKKGVSYLVTLTDNENTNILLVKRNDILYYIFFYNLSNNNIIDNTINSLELSEGPAVNEHKELIYKNTDLNLKFTYLDYIGVDDSYNSNVVYEGNSYFKLFIQVNSVVDMNKYSVEEIKGMLQLLAEEEGDLVSSNIRKVNNYDSIEFVVKDGYKTNITLYIIVSGRLYSFIFTGSTDIINSIGNELFEDVIKSIEI
jgi:hypothetical protein